MNITSSRADLQNFAKMVAFSIKRTDYISLSRESSTVVDRWLFNRLIEI